MATSEDSLEYARVQKLFERLCVDSTVEDEDWQRLHNWATEYRRKNNMTIREFLERFAIKYCSTYVQYLSAGGRNRKISNKPGTVGMILKDALLKAEQGITTEREISPRTAQKKISEYLQEKGGELNLLGIEGIVYLGYNVEENTLVVDVKANEITRTDRSKEGLSQDLQRLVAENGMSVKISVNKVSWFFPCSYSPYVLTAVRQEEPQLS